MSIACLCNTWNYLHTNHHNCESAGMMESGGKHLVMLLVVEDSHNRIFWDGWKSINYLKQWIWHAAHAAS